MLGGCLVVGGRPELPFITDTSWGLSLWVGLEVRPGTGMKAVNRSVLDCEHRAMQKVKVGSSFYDHATIISRLMVHVHLVVQFCTHVSPFSFG